MSFGSTYALVGVLAVILVLVVILLILLSRRSARARSGEQMSAEMGKASSPFLTSEDPSSDRGAVGEPEVWAAEEVSSPGITGEPAPVRSLETTVTEGAEATTEVTQSSQGPDGDLGDTAAAAGAAVTVTAVSNFRTSSYSRDPLRDLISDLVNGQGELTEAEFRRLELFKPEKLMEALSQAGEEFQERGKDLSRGRLVRIQHFAEALQTGTPEQEFVNSEVLGEKPTPEDGDLDAERELQEPAGIEPHSMAGIEANVPAAEAAFAALVSAPLIFAAKDPAAEPASADEAIAEETTTEAVPVDEAPIADTAPAEEDPALESPEDEDPTEETPVPDGLESDRETAAEPLADKDPAVVISSSQESSTISPESSTSSDAFARWIGEDAPTEESAVSLFGPESTDPLDVRITSAADVFELPEPEQVDALCFLSPRELQTVVVTAPDNNLKLAAIDELERAGTSEALASLRDCLEVPDPEIQAYALDAADRLLEPTA